MKMRAYRNLALCIIAFMMHNAISSAQINLVSNPSFEMIYSCPTSAGQIDSAIGWSTLKNGGGGTPDFFHVCCTSPLYCGVPLNTFNINFQYPHSGNAYCDIQVADHALNEYREYIQSKLIKGLSTGYTYCVKFFVSLTEQSNAYIKPLGVYFDDGSVSGPPHGLVLVQPQVFNTVQLLNDTVNWMKIEGSFTATGLETYITLGNFFPISSSEVTIIDTTLSIWYTFYFIDDVSVIDANLPPYAGNDTIIQPGDSIFIGRQPEIGLNDDCIWFVNGLPIDTIAGMWVKPDSTTTYILEQTICGNVSYDTVTVIVSGVGIETYTKDGKGITLYPNPATNTLNIESSTKFSEVIISDILGNVVIRQRAYNHAVSVDVSGLGKGLYFVKLLNENGFVVKRFLKE